MKSKAARFYAPMVAVFVLWLLVAPLGMAQDWHWSGGSSAAYTRSIGQPGIGGGEHLWMAPIKEPDDEWSSFNVAGLAASNGIAYASVSKLNLEDHESPWGKLEAREILDGELLWKKMMGEIPIESPVVIGDRIYTLVAPNRQPGAHQTLEAESILELDANTGETLRTMSLPTPGFVASLYGDGNALYAAVGSDFALDGFVEATKFDRTTGQILWSTRLPGMSPYPPLWLDGMVLIAAPGAGTTALNAETGAVEWMNVRQRPFAPLVAGSLFLYQLYQMQGASYAVEAIEPSTGMTFWTKTIPWTGPPPCTPVVLGDRLILSGFELTEFGSEQDTRHVWALQTFTGTEDWHFEMPGWSPDGCGMPANEDAVFTTAFLQDNAFAPMKTMALDPTSGMPVWASEYVRSSVFADGRLIGFGGIFTRFEVPRNEHQRQDEGWLALDAGIGPPHPPQAAFEGPEKYHLNQPFDLHDQSIPGDHPIVAWKWNINDGRGYNGYWQESTEPEASFNPSIDYDSDNVPDASTLYVTLTVMDDHFHLSSTNRTYEVFPPLSHERPAGGVIAPSIFVALVVAALFRRR